MEGVCTGLVSGHNREVAALNSDHATACTYVLTSSIVVIKRVSFGPTLFKFVPAKAANCKVAGLSPSVVQEILSLSYICVHVGRLHT